MKLTPAFFLLLLLVGLPCASQAQITVTKGTGKTTLDISGVQLSLDTAAREYLAVLQTGLTRSGFLDRGRPNQSDYAVAGNVQFDGTTLRAQITLTEANTRRIRLSKTYTATTRDIRRVGHQTADDIVREITGRPGFSSARLLMVGTRSGHKELYISDSDGKGLYQVTADKTVSVAPRWGHDGNAIFYTSYLRRFPAIYRIDLTTRNRSRVANFAGLNASAAISPDGRDLALILSRDGNPELYVMRMSDNRLTRITKTERAVEASPAWSPDGRQIVYVSDQLGTPHLYIVDRNGGTPRQLTNRGRQNVSPDWGPHGEIAYTTMIGGKFQVVVINPQTGESRQITSDFADHEDPTWAPNGRHLAVAKSISYKSKVYLVDTMGDPPILLTETEGDWYAPKWSR